MSGFAVTFLAGSLPHVQRLKFLNIIISTGKSRIDIPKWQTAREECDGKARDLEYVIKHKGFTVVEKRMIRSTCLGGFISPQKGNPRC